MATQGYLSIHGSRQGQFMGNSAKSGRSGKWIEVVSFSYAVQSPRDQATGQASGKRQHKPFEIVGNRGVWTQQMFSAFVNNEVLKDVRFEFVETSKEGKEWVYQTMKLAGVTVSSISLYSSAAHGKDSGSSRTNELTRVGLTFEKIEIDHKSGKKSTKDDWVSGS